MESPLGMPSIALMYLAHTLDPTLKVAGASGAPTIRLLTSKTQVLQRPSATHVNPSQMVNEVKF